MNNIDEERQQWDPSYFQRVKEAKHNWHNCPNCGAPVTNDECPYCGTLLIDFACIETDKPFWIKIKGQNGKIMMSKVMLTNIRNEIESTVLYADSNPYMTMLYPRMINMSFIVVE